VIILQVGDCWLWSLIIFLIQRFVLVVLGPHSLIGGVWGCFPPQNYHQGDPGEEATIFVAPLGGGFKGSTPEEKFWEKIPYKIL
jgi:hypothetical protein